MVWRFGLARDVEQVDAHEDDKEAAEERDGVDAAGGVEPLEEDGGGDNSAGGETDIVDRVDAEISGGSRRLSVGVCGVTYTLVENVSSALLK